MLCFIYYQRISGQIFSGEIVDEISEERYKTLKSK